MERGWTSVRLIEIFLVNDSFFLFFLFSWVFLLGFFCSYSEYGSFQNKRGMESDFFFWCRLYTLLDLLIFLKNKKERDDKSDIESRLLIFMID